MNNSSYGGERNVRHNLTLFFLDGVAFMPAMALISITTVIPFFLEQLGASTFQIALAASMVTVCVFMTQPLFGSIVSRTKLMAKTFWKILLLQRLIFIAFVFSIPLLAANSSVLVWGFLFFWGVFNIFAGSYSLFHTPLVIKLLPPEKRGAIRGVGFAIGSGIALGMTALIPIILNNIVFPYNFVLIFALGTFFLFLNAAVFLFMREHEDVEPRIPMSAARFVREVPSSVQKDAVFRTMIVTCTFLVIANSLLPYYTLYAIRVFGATEAHLATLAGLAVISPAIGHIVFGLIIDRKGPKTTSVIAACLVVAAGTLALVTNSLTMLFVAWLFANLGVSCFNMTVQLLLGEVAPSSKLPLYVGVLMIISLFISSAVLLLLAPALETLGFTLLFATVFACGLLSLLTNVLVFRKQLARRRAEAANI